MKIIPMTTGNYVVPMTPTPMDLSIEEKSGYIVIPQTDEELEADMDRYKVEISKWPEEVQKNFVAARTKRKSNETIL